MRRAFAYILEITNNEVAFASRFTIDITKGTGRLGAYGSGIRIPRSYIEAAQADEAGRLEFETGLVHEVTHNFSIDEALPMFAELIHYVDTNNLERLKHILDLYEHPELNESYVTGFRQIADWLGCQPEELEEAFQTKHLGALKSIFKKRLLAFIEEGSD